MGEAHEFIKQAGFLTNQILINWGTREVEIKDEYFCLWCLPEGKEINLAAASFESRSLKTSGFSRTNLISDQNKYHFKPEHTWFQPEKKKKTNTISNLCFWKHTCIVPWLRIIKAVIFPVVMYGCESCTIKKAERQRIDAF